MTIGEHIRAARKKAGFTQKQLGELAKIAEPTIRRYELGKLNPKFETLEKIANALGVPVTEFLGIDLGEMQTLKDNVQELSKLREIFPKGTEPDNLKEFESLAASLGYYLRFDSFKKQLYLTKEDQETPVSPYDLKTLVRTSKAMIKGLLDDMMNRE